MTALTEDSSSSRIRVGHRGRELEPKRETRVGGGEGAIGERDKTAQVGDGGQWRVLGGKKGKRNGQNRNEEEKKRRSWQKKKASKQASDRGRALRLECIGVETIARATACKRGLTGGERDKFGKVG